MAPQKVLEGFRRNRFLLGAASNLTLPELLSGPGGMTGHSQPCAAPGSVPGLEVGVGGGAAAGKTTKVGIPSEWLSPSHLVSHTSYCICVWGSRQSFAPEHPRPSSHTRLCKGQSKGHCPQPIQRGGSWDPGGTSIQAELAAERACLKL